ncbi:MAG: amidohydrolase family protein [Anderseniella sp.]|jgi:predicted amidohydrolase YtcJ|nr:amidohydrolase family protein [Anderseniella sp.]
MSLTRRTFALMSTSALFICPAIAASSAQADRIWSGGTIITINDASMRAEAVAEKAGRIIAVGSVDEVMKHKGPDTEMINLVGRTMLPGFVDAHGHVMGGGLQALGANVLPPPDGPNADIASLQQTLRDWIEANRDNVSKTNIVLGFGYDNAQLTELRHPTRDDLDAVMTDTPTIIIHQSGHIAVLNSKALEVVGYTAETADPEGGVIQRRAGSSEPNGVLEEVAFFTAVPKLLSSIGAEGAKAFVHAGTELWARFGYTTAQEGRAAPDTSKLIKSVADEGGLKIDVAVYSDVLVDRNYIKTNVSSDYSNHFRLAGAKLTIDGSPQGFTAWRDRPYYDPVGTYPPGYSGYAAATNDQVINAIDWAFSNGIQILTHANGEKASDLLIASIKAATEKYGPADRRPVLIHGQFQREDQVDSYRELNVFASLFPMHTFYWGDWHRDHTVGPERADNISPTGWYTKRGMMFSTHHDAPVAFPDSMRVLDATVTRRSRSNDIIGPAHRVDVMTALKAMTIWPAYQHFEENSKGSIEVGKLADFVILTDDPTAIDPERLDSIKVAATIKQGETVYAASEEELKKADLSVPSRASVDPFANFLRAAAIDRELALLPKSRRTRMTRTVLANATHNKFCLSAVVDQLAAAMVQGI